jgi:predicted RNA-binding Zn ribbon-like protein
MPSLQTQLRGRRGGALCLDFVNTVDVHDGTPSYDDLQPGYMNLLTWAEWADVVSPEEARRLLRRARREARVAAEVRRRAVALREAIFRVTTALVAEGTPDPASIATLEGEIRAASPHRHLQIHDGALAWRWSGEPVLERVLWPVVASAEALLLSPDAHRVRQCDSEACQWLFIDTTKNRSRRYCSATGCGNRERVRRFRQRTAS